MNIKISRKDLQRLLAAVSPYNAPTVSVRIQDGKLELFAQSAQGGTVLARVPLSVEESMDWKHVPLETLAEVVQNGDSDVSLEFTDRLVVTGVGWKSSIFLFPNTVFLPYDIPTPTQSIEAASLDLMTRMTEAASSDETRESLTGIHIEMKEGTLSAACADGFVLSHADLTLNLPDRPGSIYSVKALNRAKRAIGKVAWACIGFSDHALLLSSLEDGLEVVAEIPRSNGQFPNYRELIKSWDAAASPAEVPIPTDALTRFLKRARAIEGDYVVLQAFNGRVWMLSENKLEKQKCLDSLPFEGEDGSIACYGLSVLGDALKACSPNGHVKVRFPLRDKAPAMFNGQAQVIAMPLLREFKQSPFEGLQAALL
jgi:DNA polymerase III sliding clamp (beta) subunit (PCNA family)